MNHPVDGIDPEGFRRVCVRAYVRTCNMRAHDVPFARGAPPTGARGPPSIIERKRISIFSVRGVPLHRRAFLSYSHTCTHAAIEGARAEGSNTETDASGMSGPHVYSRALAIVAGDR